MPNLLAHLVLFSYPIAAILFFKMFRLPVAAALTIVLGYLFLPGRVELDLPAMPALDKHFIPVVLVIVLAVLTGAGRRLKQARSGPNNSRVLSKVEVLPGWLPGHPIAKLLVLGLIGSAFMTAFTNRETVFLGSGVPLPGFTLYSSLSYAMNLGVLILPLLVGRRLLAYPDGHKVLLALFAGIGFFYAWLALSEVFLAPQLNIWLYGFFPSKWLQHIRSGGFRPIVFLSHGLWLSIFLCMAMLAAIGAFRARCAPLPRGLWLWVALWIVAVLALCNSLGAFALAVLFAPVALLLPIRLQVLFSAIIGIMVLTYPILRGSQIMPVDRVVAVVQNIDMARADSLQFRLDNEEVLLDKAALKPLFGWGVNGRARVYDDFTGEDVSVTDGYWVIILGVGGWVRYLCEFGLLTFAFVQMAFRSKKKVLGPETGALALMLVVNLIDMMLNGTSTVLTWLLAGAMLGRMEVQSREAAAAAEAETAQGMGGRARHRAARGAFVPASARASAAKATDAAASKGVGDLAAEGDPPITGGERYSRYARGHDRGRATPASKGGQRRTL